jgi:hypothetical protein
MQVLYADEHIFKYCIYLTKQAYKRNLPAFSGTSLLLIFTIYILNDYMEQIPFREADSSSFSREISSHVWNPKVLCRLHNSSHPQNCM